MLYSHPPEEETDGRLLQNHLQKVGNITSNSLTDRETRSGTNIKKLGKIAGFYHDIGKSTSFFQDYILEEEKPNPYELKNHSSISSLVGSYYTLVATDNPRDALIVYLGIRMHHSGFDKDKSIIEKFTNRMDREGGFGIKEQNDIHTKQITDIISNNEDFLDDISEYCFGQSLESNKLKDYIENRKAGILSNHFDEDVYSDALQVWGCLIFADKNDAAQTTSKIGSYRSLSNKSIDDFVSKTEDNELNSLRENARKTIENTFNNSNADIYTISLPTGFGKTLAGLNAALEKTQKDESTLIYALPYTSIIDQTDDTIREVFDVEPKNPSYTIHHHLSETYNDYEDASPIDRKNQIRMAKSWDSSVVLTTFVQLFESLLAPRNSSGLKIQSIKDSVVILDEPQSLPIEWWNLIEKLVDMMTEKYNSTIISMTATQPDLFDDSIELVHDNNECMDYLRRNNRVRFCLDRSVRKNIKNPSEPKYITHSELGKRVESLDKNTLCVCNTIDSAKEVYKEIDNHHSLNKRLSDAYESTKDTVEYLRNVDHSQVNINMSSRHRTKDRRILLDAIRGENGLLNDEHTNVKLVSTQLIEAGVDISFEEVYRDMAPISSIVQVAGRCNRNNEIETGDVNIVYLEPTDSEKDKCPSEYVYQTNSGVNELRGVLEVLDSNRKYINEYEMISDIVHKYYDEIDGGKNEYASWINKFECEKLSRLSMIEQRDSIDVIIPNSREEKSLVQDLKNMNRRESVERFDIIDNLDDIKVSVPVDDKNRGRIISACDVIEISKGFEVYVLRDSENYSFDIGLFAEKISTGMSRIL